MRDMGLLSGGERPPRNGAAAPFTQLYRTTTILNPEPASNPGAKLLQEDSHAQDLIPDLHPGADPRRIRRRLRPAARRWLPAAAPDDAAPPPADALHARAAPARSQRRPEADPARLRQAGNAKPQAADAGAVPGAAGVPDGAARHQRLRHRASQPEPGGERGGQARVQAEADFI